MCMKRLTNINVFEELGFKINSSDIRLVEKHIKDNIDLYYKDGKIYSDSFYIGDYTELDKTKLKNAEWFKSTIIPTNTWVNYGDQNPLEHGGIWVIQENKTQYRIIKNLFDHEKIYLYDLYIDTFDEWIDKKAVQICCGISSDNLHFAIDCTDYYSYENFGTMTEFDTIEELTQELKSYGIEV